MRHFKVVSTHGDNLQKVAAKSYCTTCITLHLQKVVLMMMLAVYVVVNEKWGGNCILFFCSASVNMMPSCSINVHSAKLTYLRNGKLSRNTSCTCWNLLVTPSALSGMFIIQKFSKIYDFTAFHTLGQRLIRVHKLMKYS